MGKTWLILRHEFLVATGRTSYRVFAGLVPALGLLALVGITIWQSISAGEPPEEIAAGYVDLTRGPAGDPIFTSFHDWGTTTFVPILDVDAGKQALLDDEIDKLYVIPEEYLATGTVIEFQAATSGFQGVSENGGGNPNTTPLGRFLLNNLFVGEIGPDQANRIISPFTIAVVEIDENGEPVEDPFQVGQLLVFIAFGALLLVSIFTTSGYLLQGLNEEKENRVMEILLSSVKPEQLLFGKLFGLGAAGVLQVGIWALSGVLFVLLVGRIVDIPEELAPSPSFVGITVGLAYFVLGYFFFATLMAALGAITTSAREAGQITAFIILPAISPMWFAEPIISNPEGPIARVASVIPFTAPMTSLLRLGVSGMGPLELVISLSVLVGSGVMVMWLTARLFRAFLLTYGQRPSVAQIGRTLRGG